MQKILNGFWSKEIKKPIMSSQYHHIVSINATDFLFHFCFYVQHIQGKQQERSCKIILLHHLRKKLTLHIVKTKLDLHGVW